MLRTLLHPWLGRNVARVGWASLLAAVGLVASCNVGRGSATTRRVEPTAASRVRAAYVAARQTDAADDAAYAMRAAGGGTFVANHPRMRGRAELGARGVTLSRDTEAWRATLTTARYGCAGSLTDVQHDEGPRAGTTANRVEYAATAGGNALVEWYVHGPLGLEQGFTLPKSPCGDAREEILIEVRVEGLEPTLHADGEGVDLRDGDGVTRGRYTDLSASDARGVALGTSMGVVGAAVVLRIDAREARFPVTVDPLAWFETAKLTSSDGAAQDFFGTSVAISGSTAIVGASDANGAMAPGTGSAYVFVKSGSGWTQQQKLSANDGMANDSFGNSVAVSGGVAIVGAWHALVGSNLQQGAAYVFVQSGTTWTQQQKLVASDGAANDQLGTSVTVSGTTAIVGAPRAAVGATFGQGAAYVFTQSGTTWTQQKLAASDGASGDAFGSSVALSAGTAIVGAPSVTVAGNSQQGAAWIFVQAGSTWTQQPRLLASDGAALDEFGRSVSISGSTVIVGAPTKQVGTDPYVGAAYVFAQSGSAWSQQQKLVASDGLINDMFGTSVSVSGTTAIVGASNPANTRAGAGAAYAFARSGTMWTQQQKLGASDPSAQASFGIAVSLSGTTAIVGAPGATVGANMAQGAVFVETNGAANATACTVDTDCGSGHCADKVCCDAACAGQCQACDVVGAVGKCSPVMGQPHGARTPCAGAACGGVCNGTDVNVCAVGNADASCAAACTMDNLGVIPAGGNPGSAMTCAPYACLAGMCKMQCSNVSDCASPNVCNAARACVPPPQSAASSGSSGGCAIGVTTRAAPSRGLWVGLAGLLVRLRRRPKPARLRA